LQGRGVSLALPGQPLVVMSSRASADAVKAGGPDVSLPPRKVSPTNARGAHQNNREEKASTQFSRN
jgi:hypothetical protein